MTEGEYKKLNVYLNGLFKYLDEYYKFILDNMLDIFTINDQYFKLIGDYNLNTEFKENKLTYKDVYECARKIIESIDKKYLKLYDNLIETGQLDFNYTKEYDDSSFYHSKDINLININRYFNYEDVVVLIHEFFHYTNGIKGRNLANEILTEFISIYFETYAINYLLKEGVSKEELGYLRRIRSIYNRSYDLYYIETPLLAYNKFGNINDESLNLLNQFFTSNLSKKQFNNECNYLLEFFTIVKQNYIKAKFSNEVDDYELEERFANVFVDHFKYFFGTMWAFYAIENCDIKDIICVNDNMVNNDKKMDELMNIMKIDEFDYEIYAKAFSSITNYINKFNIKRK